MSERDIHNSILKYLRGRNAYAVKTAPPMDNGTPDIICCMGGLFLAIEVKQPGKSPSKIQEHRIRQIKSAGGVAMVATSVDDLMDQLEKVARDLKRARATRQAS